MREIKFRAWSPEDKRMQYDETDPELSIRISHFGVHENDWDGFDWSCDEDDVEKYAFMQYTGLKDINGKEIYEGDIVEAIVDIGGILHKRNLLVFHDYEYCGFLLQDLHDTMAYAFRDLDDIEIIGNIHENEDLLK
jgi:uncharacterized phage protein (TIGR01671 family)